MMSKTASLMHNNTGHTMCFIFLHDFRWKQNFRSIKYSGSWDRETSGQQCWSSCKISITFVRF